MADMPLNDVNLVRTVRRLDDFLLNETELFVDMRLDQEKSYVINECLTLFIVNIKHPYNNSNDSHWNFVVWSEHWSVQYLAERVSLTDIVRAEGDFAVFEQDLLIMELMR